MQDTAGVYVLMYGGELGLMLHDVTGGKMGETWGWYGMVKAGAGVSSGAWCGRAVKCTRGVDVFVRSF